MECDICNYPTNHIFYLNGMMVCIECLHKHSRKNLQQRKSGKKQNRGTSSGPEADIPKGVQSRPDTRNQPK